MTSRRFPPPWRVEQTPGGFKVLDASGQALAYVYARETEQQASIAKRTSLRVMAVPGRVASTTDI